MSDNLMVVGFHGKHRASEVLGQVEQLTYDWSLQLKDGVAAYRTDDGRLRIDQSIQPTTKEGAGYGVFIGSMIGALLAALARLLPEASGEPSATRTRILSSVSTASPTSSSRKSAA